MANLDIAVVAGNPQRELPGPQVNGTPGQAMRTGRYMEQYVQAVNGAKLW